MLGTEICLLWILGMLPLPSVFQPGLSATQHLVTSVLHTVLPQNKDAAFHLVEMAWPGSIPYPGEADCPRAADLTERTDKQPGAYWAPMR